MPLTRRSFVAASSTALLAPVVATPTRAADDVRRLVDGGLPADFPTQDRGIVRTVVGKAHVDYDAVRDLVTTRPELAKAAWDWGFGDWESALGAASHMGRRDIAELLMTHGARPDLFTFAMLGQVDVVRAVCVANSGIQRRHGPHGFTLLQHAQHGGVDAEPVVEYLESLGDADPRPVDEPLDAAAAGAYVGDYRPEAAADVRFQITYHERRGVLTFARDDRPLRFLRNLGAHTFSPSGAASVRIAFAVRDGRADRLTIRDGVRQIVAPRTQAAP